MLIRVMTDPGAKGVEDEMALLHAPARGWHRPSSRGKLLGGREISLPSRVEVPPCVACRLQGNPQGQGEGVVSSRPLSLSPLLLPPRLLARTKPHLSWLTPTLTKRLPPTAVQASRPAPARRREHLGIGRDQALHPQPRTQPRRHSTLRMLAEALDSWTA